MRDGDPTHTIANARCIKQTDKAILVDIEGTEMWFPSSHVSADSEVFDDEENAEGKLVVSEWIAKERGLI